MPDKITKTSNALSRDADRCEDLFSIKDGSIVVASNIDQHNPYADASYPSRTRPASPKTNYSTSTQSNIAKRSPQQRRVQTVTLNGSTAQKANVDQKPVSIESSCKPEFNEWMTVDEVAAYFGVSKSTIWRWAKDSLRFPKGRKIGPGTTRWPRSEIEAYSKYLFQLAD